MSEACSDSRTPGPLSPALLKSLLLHRHDRLGLLRVEEVVSSLLPLTGGEYDPGQPHDRERAEKCRAIDVLHQKRTRETMLVIDQWPLSPVVDR